MKRKIKPILTIVLLAFAGTTLAVQIGKEFRSTEPLRLAEGLNVVCTHATARCTACMAMERLAKETLDESFKDAVDTGKIVFRGINYERPEANDFCDEYKVATASIVLALIQDGKTVAGVNLADASWKLYNDAPAFKEMLKEQIESIIQGRILEIEDSTDEFIFDDEELFL